MNRTRVLVVDDDQPIREVLTAMLNALGYEVDTAGNGAEALAKLDQSHDIVLLDVVMPGIDGFEVARRIRNESAFSDIPICMVTGLTGKDQRLRAVEAGANDFITKPFDKTELKVRIGAILRVKLAQDTVKNYQIRLEAQNSILRENCEQLERAAKLRDEFLGIASHDLKNPITCIIGFAVLIESSIKPGGIMTEVAHDMLRRIIDRARTMERIVRDFLEYRVLEDGSGECAPEPIDLNSIASTSVEQNSAYAERKGIAVSTELASCLRPALADISHTGRVLENLISNAIKFGRSGDVVSVRTFDSGNYVFAEVSDSGPGLKQEDMAKLFVKYARLSNKPTGDEKSTGLGLAICRQLIDLNGGEIGARNNSDRGATFWFKLPAA